MEAALKLVDDPELSERYTAAVRIVEALLFAAAEPLAETLLQGVIPEGIAVNDVLRDLQAQYAGRGVNLLPVAGKWALRTAPDLGYLLASERQENRKLSRASLETLSIVAYHQPVTRAEIEDIRGIATAKGTLDVLMEIGWVRMRGRRKAPGRPITYGSTEAFLVHFGLDAIADLPGLDELKATGLLDGRTPKNFAVPLPSDAPELRGDEDALETDLFDQLAEQRIAETEPALDAGAAEPAA